MFRFGCIFFILFFSCKENIVNLEFNKLAINLPNATSYPIFVKDSCALEKQFVSKGLININSLGSSIRVSLQYSTSHNFLKKPIYEGLQDCYLPCEVAIKLSNAQYFLKQQFPYYNIIVFDATRPLHIQQKMWNELDLPFEIKINYDSANRS